MGISPKHHARSTKLEEEISTKSTVSKVLLTPEEYLVRERAVPVTILLAEIYRDVTFPESTLPKHDPQRIGR